MIKHRITATALRYIDYIVDMISKSCVYSGNALNCSLDMASLDYAKLVSVTTLSMEQNLPVIFHKTPDLTNDLTITVVSASVSGSVLILTVKSRTPNKRKQKIDKQLRAARNRIRNIHPYNKFETVEFQYVEY